MLTRWVSSQQLSCHPKSLHKQHSQPLQLPSPTKVTIRIIPFQRDVTSNYNYQQRYLININNWEAKKNEKVENWRRVWVGLPRAIGERRV